MGESTARIGIYADDKASATVKSVQGTLQRLAADAKSSILAGVGIGAGVAAFSVLQGAVRGVAGAMGDAVTAAAEEQAGIARLTTSLEENAKGWDGNIAAIEEVISSRERLGFADDEQRDSLAVLTSVTKDATKALELQRTAMDLARLRGMDLATASLLIGKVYAGNIGILSRYGIQLEAGTTATEALAEIQKRAAGQAEAFGDTAAGAAAALQIELENLSEDVGTLLLPLLKELAVWAREELVPALRDVVAWFDENSEAIGNIAGAIGKLLNPMGTVVTRFEELAGAAEESGSTTARSWTAMGEALAAAAPAVTAGATAMAHGIQESARNARLDAANEARAIPGAVAAAMLEGMDDIQTVMDQVQTLLADEWTDASRLAYLKGQLIIAEEGLAAGIAQGDSAAVSAAQEAVSLVMAEIGLLEGGVYAEANASMTSLETVITNRKIAAGTAAAATAKLIRDNLAFDATQIGSNIIFTLSAGMRAAMYAAYDAAILVQRKVGGVLAFARSPWYTGSRKIGEMVGKTYGQGLEHTLDGLRSNVSGLLPGGGGGSGGFGGGAVGGGGSPIVIQLVADSRVLAEMVTREQYYMAPTTALYPKG